jgi:hypothetical protein
MNCYLCKYLELAAGKCDTLVAYLENKLDTTDEK